MSGVEALRERIAAHLSGWETAYVEEAIFGSAESAAIALAVARFCEEALGAAPVGCLRWTSSVGAAAGLILADGRRVLLKAHQPGVSAGYLEAVGRVRRALLAGGFPGPAPLLGPSPLGRGLATVEEFVEGGAVSDGFAPAVRRALAEGLARFTRLASALEGRAGLSRSLLGRRPGEPRWPAPHSRLFDFEASAAGAGWIDDLADRAREILFGDRSPLVVSHFDWRVEHVRLREGRIYTVYDWDSVCEDRESVAVGGAAAHWPADWSTGASGRKVPSPEESDLFVREYEAARGAPFTREERGLIGAARLYALAYSARCGHCLGPPFPGGAEEALSRYGAAYLSVG